MTAPRQLFADYCFFREQTAHYKTLAKAKPFLRQYKATPQRLQVLQEMSEWCDQQGVPDREWLYSLFVSRGWTFSPKIIPSHLMSKHHLKRFPKITDYDFFSYYLHCVDNIHKLDNVESRFDPNRDISTTVESAKDYYLRVGGAKECRERMLTETFGYHPDSKICRTRCLDQSNCLQELRAHVGFDILALRMGKLSQREARQQAFFMRRHG